MLCPGFLQPTEGCNGKAASHERTFATALAGTDIARAGTYDESQGHDCQSRTRHTCRADAAEGTRAEESRPGDCA
jgi:hypothetical protein